MKWWRAGLSAEQVAKLEREASEAMAEFGPKAQVLALDRARAFGKRYFKEAAWLSRVAGCIADMTKQASSNQGP